MFICEPLLASVFEIFSEIEITLLDNEEEKKF
jgi:hypothetical protein